MSLTEAGRGEESATSGQAEYAYDAYLSYAEADRDWVEQHLAPRLEEAGRRICMEDDLPPGGVEIEERSRALAASRKTLLVISPEYMAGRWTLLDEAVTRELDPASRKRRLIPILRGAEAPLRIRPLLAVDLRLGGSSRQWKRLLKAVDPAQQEEPINPLQGFSLRLAGATRELKQTSWHGVGALCLATAYLTLASVLALALLLVWEAPPLMYALNLLVIVPIHGLIALVWREDRDVFRRLSHLVGLSNSTRGGTMLLAGSMAALWGWTGVPVARELLCGPWGCRESGKIYLTLSDFQTLTPEAPEAASWIGSTQQTLAQKLQAAPGVEILGQGLLPIDDQALEQLDVDYIVVGQFERQEVPVLTAYLWNRHRRPEPPEVSVRGAAGDGVDRRLELQHRLALALLDRLGIEVAEEESARLAVIPTDRPRALALNDEAVLLRRAGREGEAEAKLRDALALDPDFALAWSNLAEVAWRAGRLEEALEYRRNAVKRLPTYAPFHYNLGHLLALMGDDRQALRSLLRAAELDAAHAPTYNEMGKVLLQLGKARKAVKALEKGLLIDPGFAAAAKNLGRAQLASGETAAAIRALEHSLSLYPTADWQGQTEAHALLVEAHARRGEATACRHLSELQRLDPEGIAPWTPSAVDTARGLACFDSKLQENLDV